MSDGRPVLSEVEVAVDPETAFAVFTEELDLWWVRGPINFWRDGGRVFALRFEPGVGGRLLTVYDSAHGEALEMGRITTWEPGARLVWQSALDDVETEVRFEPSPGGTRVVVEARIPPGGSDRGGTAWTRVVPRWLPRWLARRDHVEREVRDLARLALAVHYERPAAAARWLADVFGFEADELPTADGPGTDGEHGDPWIEFRIGDSSLMLFRLEADGAAHPSVHVPWVYVEDLDAHLARAEEKGAKVLERHAWGWLATYVAEDLEGNRWTFAQARPTQLDR
ncbi:MAG TPA: VOC family protein [Egibacteraceae bacterium]|jgi:uncharacterized glyoxalase superfamily protein PhnB|nr:VOC family protein [Egibacteraceae bacterium]